MNEPNQKEKPSRKEEALKPNGGKSPWQRPTLTFLGEVKDLVQGGGKSGDTADSDPGGTEKRGVG